VDSERKAFSTGLACAKAEGKVSDRFGREVKVVFDEGHGIFTVPDLLLEILHLLAGPQSFEDLVAEVHSHGLGLSQEATHLAPELLSSFCCIFGSNRKLFVIFNQLVWREVPQRSQDGLSRAPRDDAGEGIVVDQIGGILKM
jgi:hypothetical protein